VATRFSVCPAAGAVHEHKTMSTANAVFIGSTLDDYSDIRLREPSEHAFRSDIA
jgi:hypothetical protein